MSDTVDRVNCLKLGLEQFHFWSHWALNFICKVFSYAVTSFSPKRINKGKSQRLYVGGVSLIALSISSIEIILCLSLGLWFGSLWFLEGTLTGQMKMFS